MIENGTYLAHTHPGLEAVLEKELKKAGASYLFKSEGQIRFKAEDEQLYTFLLRSRVLTGFELLLSQPVDISKADIATLTASVNWGDVIPLHSIFRVQAFHNGSSGGNLRVLASEMEKSICTYFEHTFESAPKAAGEQEDPEFVINIQIGANGSCLLTLDAGGPVLEKRSSLHRTGTSVVSPALAAGLITLSGWNGRDHFFDPFANNGAFLIEAARIAKKRTPLFEDDSLLMKKWRIFRHALWKKKREEIVDEMRKDVNWIHGSDINHENISRVQYLSRLLRLNSNIKLRVAKPNTLTFPAKGIIVTAPPPQTDLKLLGDFARIVRMHANGYKLNVFSSLVNIDTIFGMKPENTLKIEFEGRDYTFQQFQVFDKKEQKTSKPGAKSKAARTPGKKPGKKPVVKKDKPK